MSNYSFKAKAGKSEASGTLKATDAIHATEITTGLFKQTFGYLPVSIQVKRIGKKKAKKEVTTC